MAELRDLVPSEFKDSLSEAEKLILKNAPTGEWADMQSGDEEFDKPENADKWAESRTVRARFLGWLLRDKKARDFIHDKGIIIVGMRIDGELDLNSLTFPFPLIIQYSYFANKVDLRFARIKLIVFQKSHFNNFHADGLVIEQSADFSDSRSEGEFLVVGANIGGDLVCNGATFINKKGDAFSGDGITTKGSVSLKGTKCLGKIRLVGANIGATLDCDGARFMNKNGEAFNGDRMATKGNFSLRGIRAWRGFRLVGADIGASLGCHDAKFINKKGESFIGDTITTKGDIFLNQIESKGEFRLVSTHIGGDLYCEGASFQNKEKTTLRLTEAQIGGRLCLDRIKKIEGTIDIENAKADALRDDMMGWPEQGNLIINGFEYGAFTADSPSDASSRLQWLGLQRKIPFVPQPYEQLARVFRRVGRGRDAQKVLFRKEFDGIKYSDDNIFMKIVRSLFLFSGLRGNNIKLVFFWIVLLIILGSVIFQAAEKRGLMLRTLPDISLKDEYLNRKEILEYNLDFNHIVYSLDSFFPIVDLYQQRYWHPDSTEPQDKTILCKPLGWWLRLYYWIHIILGWVYSTLTIATLTDRVRKR